MCPNCILNQQGLDVGMYIAFGICFVFFFVSVAAMWWAFKNGDFENSEDIKFDMMDDELDGGEVAARARAAIERKRTQQSTAS